MPPKASSTSLPIRFRQPGRIIRAGGLIAYPTEGVYGLGCRPDLPAAVERLLAVKGRPAAAGLILIAANLDQLADWIAPTTAEARRLKEPRGSPVTWIVTAGALAPGWITGGRPTIAVRVIHHPVAAALCRAAGMPLVSTSANRRGRPPARSALAVRRWFGPEIDLVVGGQTGGAPGPSEIRDARSGAVLRRA